MPAPGVPSESILGLNLSEGWYVAEQINKHPHATGGNFSSGYKVTKDASARLSKGA